MDSLFKKEAEQALKDHNQRVKNVDLKYTFRDADSVENFLEERQENRKGCPNCKVS